MLIYIQASPSSGAQGEAKELDPKAGCIKVALLVFKAAGRFGLPSFSAIRRVGLVITVIISLNSYTFVQGSTRTVLKDNL